MVSSKAPVTCSEPARFCGSSCGLVVGLLLLGYSLFDAYLYQKFTPVYKPTRCGDQTADLQHFSLGDPIRVGLRIQVTCSNPNSYAVRIKSATPGHVYVGMDRAVTIGMLTLIDGSTLPEGGKGTISINMDAEIAADRSNSWISRFLSDAEIPLFFELQFDVGVSVSFGLSSFGTTAPFVKKCGLQMAGLLVNADRRLGPVVCRDSFAELADALPHVGDKEFGSMSFSAAQMDPDRIRMGEEAKNISIIGVGGLCFIFGTMLVCAWCRKCANPEADAEASRELYATMDAGAARKESRIPPCLRGSSGNTLLEMQAAHAQSAKLAGNGNNMSRAMGMLLKLSPYTAPQEVDISDVECGSPRSAGNLWGYLRIAPRAAAAAAAAGDASPTLGIEGSGNCLFKPVVSFLSCNRAASASPKRGRSGASSPASPWSLRGR